MSQGEVLSVIKRYSVIFGIFTFLGPKFRGDFLFCDHVFLSFFIFFFLVLLLNLSGTCGYWLYHVFHETQMAMAMAVVITKVATRAGAVVYAVKVRITAFLDTLYYPSFCTYFALSFSFLYLVWRFATARNASILIIILWWEQFNPPASSQIRSSKCITDINSINSRSIKVFGRKKIFFFFFSMLLSICLRVHVAYWSL